MQWGKDIEMLQSVEKETGITPPALLNRPKIGLFEVFLLQEFNAVSGSRDYGENGPKAVPISDIKAYLEICEDYKTPADKLRFMRLMQRLDQAFRAHETEKIRHQREAQRTR